MNSAIERLLCLRVCDVMTRDVISVPASRPMPDAAGALTDAHISGAPVVNDQGQCVGVLSASDFVYRAAWAADAVRPNGAGARPAVADGGARRPPTDLVASYMSPALHAVNVSRSLMDAARLMCLHHVHRLVVLDDGGKPAGVLTSLDLVAAFIAAIEE